ncbi:MAG: EAL domain-containing protein [Lachnospiraceae bacterium]|nr:EAL domain-containing protein [Lachnospiraceae bacterium]
MRRYEVKDLTKRMDKALKKKKPFYLVIVRLARLGDISAKYGFEVMNQLVEVLWNFLADNSSKKNVFVLSGLSYAVYFESEEKTVTAFANLVRERFNRNFRLKGINSEISVPNNVKIIPVTDNDKDSKQIIELINFAVEEPTGQAKEHDTFIDDNAVSMREKAVDMEKRLDEAIRNGDFKVFYQPIINFETGHADSAEAFVRLYDEHKELLNTIDLIRIAKQNGSIIQLTDFVIARVCELISRGILDDKDMKYIQINLSKNDWEDPRLFERLMSVVKSNNVGTGQLMLELTEECISDDMDTIAKNVEELNRVGFHIAMDNFGAANTNITQMLHLPIEVMKIDREFVSRAHLNPYDMDILSGMITLFQKFKLQIVAEGVENPNQHEMVVDLGCTQGQGNHYGVPVNEESFIAGLNA